MRSIRPAARRAASPSPVPPLRPTAFAALLLLVLLAVLPLAGCGGGSEEAAETPETAAPTQPAPTAPAPAGPADVSSAAREYGDLPPQFRGLVRAEMTNLEPAMQRLMAFIARGDSRMGAFTARQIEETFVLKRSMTEEERQQMVSQLPEAFLELDREFHAKAGEVAQALDAGRFREASDLYGEMTRLCVSCHGRYALGRFPRLAGVAAEEAAGAEPEAEVDGAAGPGDTAASP